jgi:hypothetical protein
MSRHVCQCICDRWSHTTSQWTKCLNRLDQRAPGGPSRLSRQQQAQRTADLCARHTRRAYHRDAQMTADSARVCIARASSGDCADTRQDNMALLGESEL